MCKVLVIFILKIIIFIYFFNSFTLFKFCISITLNYSNINDVDISIVIKIDHNKLYYEIVIRFLYIFYTFNSLIRTLFDVNFVLNIY